MTRLALESNVNDTDITEAEIALLNLDMTDVSTLMPSSDEDEEPHTESQGQPKGPVPAYPESQSEQARASSCEAQACIGKMSSRLWNSLQSELSLETREVRDRLGYSMPLSEVKIDKRCRIQYRVPFIGEVCKSS